MLSHVLKRFTNNKEKCLAYFERKCFQLDIGDA